MPAYTLDVPILLGLLVLVTLSASSAATRLFGTQARLSELVLAIGVIGNLEILLPVYTLGHANLLTKPWLIAATMLGALLILISTIPIDGDLRRHHVNILLGNLRTCATAPFRTVAEYWREKQFLSLVSMFFISYLVLMGLLIACIAPSDHGFDDFWYHQSIVGYTIQNHGFAKTGSPFAVIDSFPRASEMAQLWFATLGAAR